MTGRKKKRRKKKEDMEERRKNKEMRKKMEKEEHQEEEKENVERRKLRKKSRGKRRRQAIHSFILAISIAPLKVLYYSEALPTTTRIGLLYRSFTPKRTGGIVGKGLHVYSATRGSNYSNRFPHTFRSSHHVSSSTSSSSSSFHLVRLHTTPIANSSQLQNHLFHAPASPLPPPLMSIS